MVEARYARGRSLVMLAIALGALALNTGLLLYHPPPSLILWLVGGVLVALGLRGLDRRVKLRIDPEGLFYAPWGARTLPWNEFAGFAPFERKNVSWIEVRARYPEQLLPRLSLSARADAWLNARFDRPPLYINPVQLDVPAPEILAALERNRNRG